MTVFQLTSWLDVIPEWFPPTIIALGFTLLTLAIGIQYFGGIFNYNQSRFFAFFAVTCMTASIGGAMYVTFQNDRYLLMFVYSLFISGRMVQGAIAARIFQKILDFFLPIIYGNSTSGNDGQTKLSQLVSWAKVSRLVSWAKEYIWNKIKHHLLLITITGIISLQTILSIVAVYTIGSGETIEAVERLWIGIFFLIIIGMIYDFRHFSHRISWPATIGLILAITGALLYNPIELSTYTNFVAPYVETPIPDWARWPVGTIGFLFGIIVWAIVYAKIDR